MSTSPLELSRGVHWCTDCGVPVAGQLCGRCGAKLHIRMARDLVPVFREEFRLLCDRLDMMQPCSARDFVLWNANTEYYLGGQAYASINYDGSAQPRIDMRTAETASDIIYTRFSRREFLERLYLANRARIVALESEAIEFVSRTAEAYPQHAKMVAFSGGKDSTVVSHIVRKALGSASILHVFSDTSVEARETIRYTSRFRQDNPRTPFIVVRPHADFLEMCSSIGPPSRIHRWCCTSHKTAPMATMVSILGEQNGVLTFDGIRASESARRSRYDRITTRHKIENEVLASPIQSWRDFDVWIYILSLGLRFNTAYRKGFRRVGCLPCPFNSRWSEYLTSVWYPEQAVAWRGFLLQHARSTGHPAPEKFALTGWKSRSGGRGLRHDLASVAREECMREENTYSYTLAREWDDGLLEFLKPFGTPHIQFDDGITLRIDIRRHADDAKLASLAISRPRRHIRVTFDCQKNLRLLIQRFEKQIKRFQSCILCGGCASKCPQSAIRLNGKYLIDQGSCTGCLKCVRARCVATESLTLKGARQVTGEL